MSFASSKAVASVGSVGISASSASFSAVSTPSTAVTSISNPVYLESGAWLLRVSVTITPAVANDTDIGRTVLRLLNGAGATVQDFVINVVTTGALASASGPLIYCVCFPVTASDANSSQYSVSLIPVITAGTAPTASASLVALKLV